MKRRARLVSKLAFTAETERYRRAAFGDHECYPFPVQAALVSPVSEQPTPLDPEPKDGAR